MKKITLVLTVAISTFILSSCGSTVEVVNAWKSDKLSTLKDANILVITRTEENKNRGAFEEQMVAYLKKKNIKASTSYMKIPIFDAQRVYSDEEKQELVDNIKKMGFDAIILTSLKKRTEKTVVTQTGGYYSGGNYNGMYPQYYGGFNGYYNHRGYETYVPSETYTDVQASFILETVFFNLNLSSTEQLVAVVTSAVEDPATVYVASQDYVKEIAKSLKN
tara:strand:+ start:51402 stop:52061 length:660 start_codon:yes stop_codon:yes gene_type:complete